MVRIENFNFSVVFLGFCKQRTEFGFCIEFPPHQFKLGFEFPQQQFNFDLIFHYTRMIKPEEIQQIMDDSIMRAEGILWNRCILLC